MHEGQRARKVSRPMQRARLGGGLGGGLGDGLGSGVAAGLACGGRQRRDRAAFRERLGALGASDGL